MSDPTVQILRDGVLKEMTLPELISQMRMGMRATELTISCNETWQKRQFEPKTYFSSMQFDLSAAYAMLEDVAEDDKAAVRSALAQMVRQQAIASDNFQRETIRHIAQLDGIKAANTDIIDRRTGNAKSEGSKAAQNGVPLNKNPYAKRTDPEGIQLSKGWVEGWQLASA